MLKTTGLSRAFTQGEETIHVLRGVDLSIAPGEIVALAGIPMIAAYKVSPIDAFIVRRLVRVPSYILANLVLGENVVPEIVQEECTPERLADALVPLFANTPERRSQVDAFARLDAIMEIGSRTPAARAADVVLSTLRRS